jgi:hypothetical protein
MTWRVWVDGRERATIEATDFTSAQLEAERLYPAASCMEVYRSQFPDVPMKPRPTLVKAGQRWQ